MGVKHLRKACFSTATFVFAGLPNGGAGLELDQRLPVQMRQENNQSDVFCVVKHFLSDDHLSQKPLLVWPTSLKEASASFCRQINSTRLVHRAEVEQERGQELLELAGRLEADFPSLARAAAYYRDLVFKTGLCLGSNYFGVSWAQVSGQGFRVWGTLRCAPVSEAKGLHQAALDYCWTECTASPGHEFRARSAAPTVAQAASRVPPASAASVAAGWQTFLQFFYRGRAGVMHM